jgi:hypothetical protein
MEVDVDLEAVVSVPFSSAWFSLPVLHVDEIPLLVGSTVLFPHVDISVLSVNCT